MFPCTQCGACCRKAGIAIEHFKKQGISFPYKAKEDGSCEMLENNLCKVYNERPDICRLNVQAKLLGIKEKKYYRKSIVACNKLMDEQNVPQEFRIRVLI